MTVIVATYIGLLARWCKELCGSDILWLCASRAFRVPVVVSLRFFMGTNRGSYMNVYCLERITCYHVTSEGPSNNRMPRSDRLKKILNTK